MTIKCVCVCVCEREKERERERERESEWVTECECVCVYEKGRIKTLLKYVKHYIKIFTNSTANLSDY